jgi:hypothetical protein
MRRLPSLPVKRELGLVAEIANLTKAFYIIVIENVLSFILVEDIVQSCLRRLIFDLFSCELSNVKVYTHHDKLPYKLFSLPP